ncbi:conserved membrane hypothetical protein [Frankia sp. AiPs1]|uniref:hypothetical protein n=1 Tax=Frankia sp. AiPa1 TaxID=573492 RepID=UPI00202B428F|nr:hypothetical protein [Frankia sp. AiPa1]MCL9759209.1 hypothetical protein [Frankia sp. AiPa1]
MRPLIAVIGSLVDGQAFRPAVTDVERGQRACADLGRELAMAGCDLLVYDSRPKFVEAHVVRGYVAAGPAPDRSIHVRLPLHKPVEFPEMEQKPELFQIQPQDASSWDVPFLRSLTNADGLLLIGGGRSTVVAGMIALTLGKPMIVAAQFGGGASMVWREMHGDSGEATEDELREMAAQWSDTSARRLVAGLSAQAERRAARAAAEQAAQRRTARRSSISLLVAALLLLAAIAVIPVAWAARPGSGGSLALLLAAPILAAMSGALIRNSYEQNSEWIKAGVRGLAAGAISFLLFVASQIAGTPDLLDGSGARRLLFYVLPIGFVGGLTFDAVYARLRSADVADVSPIVRP